MKGDPRSQCSEVNGVNPGKFPGEHVYQHCRKGKQEKKAFLRESRTCTRERAWEAIYKLTGQGGKNQGERGLACLNALDLEMHRGWCPDRELRFFSNTSETFTHKEQVLGCKGNLKFLKKAMVYLSQSQTTVQ